MGCSACGGGGTVVATPRQTPQQREKAKVEPNPDCPFTSEFLKLWYKFLQCVKDNNKLDKIGLTVYQANVHLGNIQSAINFPDNYCYFQAQLTDYQKTILPRIISNVSGCLQ